MLSASLSCLPLLHFPAVYVHPADSSCESEGLENALLAKRTASAALRLPARTAGGTVPAAPIPIYIRRCWIAGGRLRPGRGRARVSRWEATATWPVPRRRGAGAPLPIASSRIPDLRGPLTAALSWFAGCAGGGQQQNQTELDRADVRGEARRGPGRMALASGEAQPPPPAPWLARYRRLRLTPPGPSLASRCRSCPRGRK